MNRFHLRALVALTAALVTTLTVCAEPVTIVATWSGLNVNNASASARITFDSTALTIQNPGFTYFKSQPVALELHVANSLNPTSNSTTFTLANFQAAQIGISSPLNLTANWVGQPGFDQFVFVGNTNEPNTPSVIGSTGLGVLIPHLFVTENMTLTSVRMVPTTVSVGDPIANLPGIVLSALHTPSVDPNGVDYFAGTVKSTLKPSNLVSGRSNCVLSWDPSSGNLAAVLQSGLTQFATHYNEVVSFKSFGSPVFAAGQLYFQCTLNGGYAYFNDGDSSETFVQKGSDAMLVSNAPGSNTIVRYAQTGEPAPLPVGFSFTKFDWFHAVNGGLFFGAQTSDGALPKPNKSQGVYFSNGSIVTPLAVAGGPVYINGDTLTVKAVSKPIVTAPAQADTRVGNDDSVALIVTTMTGQTTIKNFPKPPPLQ